MERSETRLEFMLAMRRASTEMEKELVDRRIDEAFEQVYDYLEPAAAFLRATCDDEGRRALAQLERAYQRALEIAARSGLGCRPPRSGNMIPQRQPVPGARFPTAAGEEAAPVGMATSAGADTVLFVRPVG